MKAENDDNSSDSELDRMEINREIVREQLGSKEDIKEVLRLLQGNLRVSNIFKVEIEIKEVNHLFSSLYTIKGLLGKGSFGIVLEVQNLRTDEISALKILHRENSKHMFRMTDETMEQQALQDLEHENIIVFKRILFSLDLVFIEMEKINGGTLQAFITQEKKERRKEQKHVGKVNVENLDQNGSPNVESRGTTSDEIGQTWIYQPVLDEQVASKIAKDIMSGLTQIHKQNYIHRDLKPENILLNVETD